MNLQQTMAALERAGSEQTRKTYRRHGAKEPMFGVSYAALYALQKQTGTDQALAEQLWDTGNHDARVLAMLIADGEQMTAAKLNRWRRAVGNSRFMMMSFSAVAARCKAGLACALQWIDGKDEFEQAVGWGALAGFASTRSVSDDTFAPLLPRLQRVMHDLPNYARYFANNCLIAIGGRPGFTNVAMAVAQAVGRVEVDHGDTECGTPDASTYIVKMATRKAAKAETPKKAPAKAAKPKTTVKKGAKKAAKKSAKKTKARR